MAFRLNSTSRNIYKPKVYPTLYTKGNIPIRTLRLRCSSNKASI